MFMKLAGEVDLEFILPKMWKTENRQGMPNLPFLTAPATYSMDEMTIVLTNIEPWEYIWMSG